MPALNSPTPTFHKTTYPALSPTLPAHSASNKTIVITGGGTGIGAATARYFALASAPRIYILGRREVRLLETKSSIEAESPKTTVTAVSVDITDSAATCAAFKKIGANGKIDVLIANAAVTGPIAPLADVSPKEWVGGISTNLLMSMNTVSAFLPHAADKAVIIETNSAAAHMDFAPSFSSYTVAKLAVARLYQCVAFEHPSIRVHSVQPGAIDTEMSRGAGYKPQSESEGEEFQWKGEGAEMVAERDDVSLPASFYVWLASGEGEFLRGKYLWANWDVEELKGLRERIEGGSWLSVGLQGWPFVKDA